jgi:hypothetical protein
MADTSKGSSQAKKGRRRASTKNAEEHEAAAVLGRVKKDPLLDVPTQPFLRDQLYGDTTKAASQSARAQRGKPIEEIASDRVRKTAPAPYPKLPEEIRQSVEALSPKRRTLHGAKFSLAYFPRPHLRSDCADRFCYLSSDQSRASTKLPFTPNSKSRLEALGAAMAAPGRDSPLPDSTLDAGLTYVGQFVDHDITLDVSSSLEVETDATTIHNMRSPSLDLDSVYGQGPAMDPFLYDMPGLGVNPTAIKLQVGTNLSSGDGGPGGTAGFGGMVQHSDRDVPRVASDTHTAIIGDPRNDENLIIVQFHHAMLRFHNAMVDALLLSGFSGDIFVEAKRRVTHHYQWAVVNDFLRQVCGDQAVDDALSGVDPEIDSPFCMPVEFSVAAYRYGHSMIRDHYWLNFNFTMASLAEVFAFNRVPNLPVRSNWVVDLNAFFSTGIPVPVFNKARKIDTGIANGLTALPGLSGMLAELAMRNLLRGLALGLPSGQGMASEFGISPLTETQLLQGLPNGEADVLDGSGKLLLKKTPLWYYVLREAAVLENGDRLGPVGGRIVAETLVRMLKRDPDSYLNVPGGFTPFLPSAVPGDFTFSDLLIFSGMTQP